MLSFDQLTQFNTDGFVSIPDFLDADRLHAAIARFDPLFRGEFATGIQPDEWNWRGDDNNRVLTRQICNGWKADLDIARVVLDERVGEYCARLMGWKGTRINQDNVLWKPPGATAVGFHQDNAYQNWIVPAEMVTCWIALDQTTISGGTIAHARGSHRWRMTQQMGQFHDPEDHLSAVKAAAAELEQPLDIVELEVSAGTAVFHHGATWHGSGPNQEDRPRRALVSHCIKHDATFHPHHNSPIYSRYRQLSDLTMAESFFPILWTESGVRTEIIPILAVFCD
jgi:ectoine hydroxylase-related dioxygenase (phytanoyl-CoA dioxygenase family)